MKLPQLSLRDLLWLVLVCGVCCRWWIDHRWLEAEIERLKPQLIVVVDPSDSMNLKVSNK